MKIKELQKELIDNTSNKYLSYGPHFTLKSLGDITDEIRGEISCKLSEFRYEPFEIQINKIGFFERNLKQEGSYNVLFLIPESKKIIELHKNIHKILKPFTKNNYYTKFEGDNYKPHITLNSKLSDEDLDKAKKLFNKKKVNLKFIIDKISIISRLETEYIYKRVIDFPFQIPNP